MPTTPSARLGLIGPTGSDLISQGDDVIRAIIAQLEVVGARIDSGSAAARPAASIINRFYWATDTGVLSRDSGTAWTDINPKDASAGTASLRTLGAGAAQAAAGNDARLSDQRVPTDGSVAAVKLAGALADLLGVSGVSVRRAYAAAAGTVSTSSSTPVDLSGGPGFDISGPANGLAIIATKADILAPGGGNSGQVHLVLDGVDYGEIMGSGVTSWVSRWTLPGSPGGGSWPLGGFLVQDLSTPRGFSLQYSSSGGTASFRNRALWVLTLGF